MTRKLSVISMIILLVSLFAANPARAAKSYYAEYFDVQIDLQEGGSAIVTETVKFHFEGDPFTFAFREVSARETDGLTFLDASMDGSSMPQGTQPGQVEVETGDPLKVTWHFSPTSDAAHVFTVRYRADGVIRKVDGDTLLWRAVPENHDYSIDRSTITLTYPPRATLLAQPTLDWNYDAKWEDDRLLLTASGLAEDDDLILTAHFSQNSLTAAAPGWQVQKERVAAATAKALPVGFGAGIAALILGGLGLFTFARSNARELNVSPVISSANPPSNLSPALVGKLTKQPQTFMGTIFDLAQRGVLEIREGKSIWGTKNYDLVRKDHNEMLTPFEHGLMEILFKPNDSEVNMNQVSARLATQSALFDEPLEEELLGRGWLDLERKQKRTRIMGAGWVILFLSLIVFILSLIGAGASLAESPNLLPWLAAVAGISAGLFFVSIFVVVYGAAYSTLTPTGEEQAARWGGFAEYLKQVSKGKEPAIRPDYFERYLAYATIFGLGSRWAKYFQELGGVPLPIWFHATAGGDPDFAAIVAVMSASDSAGAGGDGGAAGGASGGGSSGAG